MHSDEITRQIFPVDDLELYREAGPTDLIELLPVRGHNSIFVEKWRLEMLFYGLVRHEFTHLSGPTGSAKTSLIEALYLEPRNIQALCRSLGYPIRPLSLHPIEMVIFDVPGELIQRRGLDKGTTFDERSSLVTALLEASSATDEAYQVIWLRELGRVHSASIQGGLLDLMTHGEIMLPDGTQLPGQDIAWIADSNYQAESEAVHTLVVQDDGLKRRFTVNLTLDYPGAEQEVMILRRLVLSGQLPDVDDELILGVVRLGQAVREHRAEGNLLSVPPPTIYGYMAFLRVAHALAHLGLSQVAQATLLGNASNEDQKLVPGVFNEVFGLQSDFDEDLTAAGNLF